MEFRGEGGGPAQAILPPAAKRVSSLLPWWGAEPPPGQSAAKRGLSLHGPDVGGLLREEGVEEDPRLLGVHPAVGEGVLQLRE